jgi:diacylglycerol kinase (ATP)
VSHWSDSPAAPECCFPDAEPDDGFLALVVIAPRNILEWGLLVGRVVRRAEKPDRRLARHRGRRILVEASRTQPRQLDGDVIEEGRTMDITIEAQALRISVL